MNNIILMGRLNKDPEVRQSGENKIARYTLAVDRRFKRDGQPEADFFNCTVFAKGAEFAEKYLAKGIKIVVSGRMESDNYTNKDGEKVYGWQVIVDQQEFAESKAASQGNKPEPKNEDKYVPITADIEEDLPFI